MSAVLNPIGKSNRTLSGIARTLYLIHGQDYTNKGNLRRNLKLAPLGENLNHLYLLRGDKDGIRI